MMVVVIDMAAFPGSTCLKFSSSSRRAKRRFVQITLAPLRFSTCPSSWPRDRHFLCANAQSRQFEALLGKKFTNLCPHAQIQYRGNAGHVRNKNRTGTKRAGSFYVIAAILMFCLTLFAVIVRISTKNYATVRSCALRWGYLYTGEMLSLGPNVLRAYPALGRHRPRNAFPPTSGAQCFDSILNRNWSRSAPFASSRVRCSHPSYNARTAEAP